MKTLVAQLLKRRRRRKQGACERKLMGRPTPAVRAAYFPWGANNFAKIHGGRHAALCTHKSTLANRIWLDTH